MSETKQSFENHAKFVPGYHYVLGMMAIVLVLFSAFRLATDFSLDRAAFFLVTVAILMTAFYARVFALGVQDRVIRLEEQLRLERILPEPLRARVGDLSTEQLIALRFASDEEVGELASKALDEGLADRKTIKALIRNWRPDHQRT